MINMTIRERGDVKDERTLDIQEAVDVFREIIQRYGWVTVDADDPTEIHLWPVNQRLHQLTIFSCGKGACFRRFVDVFLDQHGTRIIPEDEWNDIRVFRLNRSGISRRSIQLALQAAGCMEPAA